jgi:HTH-type transcriptional repressor of NAD biosynthesis genes
MPKRFRAAIVVGKFAPLTSGHEYLIRCAQNDADQLILITYCNPPFEEYDTPTRKTWLQFLFPQAHVIAVDAGDVPLPLPENDDPTPIHGNFCAFLCETQLPTITPLVEAVFSSEDYGPPFAHYLSERWHRPIQHVMVDRERTIYKISGTQVRRDIHAHRQWLDPHVYSNFVKRIAILGGESSGKTTLAQIMATDFRTRWVAEYGRNRWEERQGHLQFEDMLDIAVHQVAFEDDMALKAVKYLFCDTSPLTTLFYSMDLFGCADVELIKLAQRSYHRTLLCAPDFDFVQDGTRRHANFRLQQHHWYLRQLERLGMRYEVVTGSVQSRLKQVEGLLASHSNYP